LNLEEKTFNLIIILVEPSGPINIGSIARLCSNFNVNQLRIVSPKCDIRELDARKMALKGFKFIEYCKIYNTLCESISDCNLVLATSGRVNYSEESEPFPLENISTWLKNFREIGKLGVIFGREDRGLTNNELLMAQRVFTINTNINNPSLNLSHAVSIVLYEINKLEKLNTKGKITYNLASSSQMEETFSDIEKLLLKIGYILPHTSNSMISKFKKYILKAETSKHQLDTLRGVVHQINWALKNLKN
tara:strand:- start:2054 stop:2797 length:744 start_codon:yes stop_codon:yes gene_type:complete